MRPISASVGPNAAAGTSSRPIRLDEWADAPLGVQVAIQGAANFTVQHSFDDPNDLTYPVPVAQMFWDTGLIPAGAIGATTPITFAVPTAPLYMRLMMNSGAGTARITITQYNVVDE